MTRPDEERRLTEWGNLQGAWCPGYRREWEPEDEAEPEPEQGWPDEEAQ